MKSASYLVPALSGLWLTACGSGSDGNGAGAPVINNPPVFTSPTSITVDENTSGEIYQLAVADPDGDAVTLSVVSGNDEDAFSIDLDARTISVASGLNFEQPADGDADNDYIVVLRAEDKRGGRTQFTVTITVTDVAETGSLRQIASGLSQPVFADPIPGTNTLAVVERSGRVRVLDADSGAVESVPLLDVTSDISTDGEGGLLGLAFSPDFETDGTFYINMTNAAGDTEIRSYQMFSGSTTQADPATKNLIISIAQPFGNHNAGWIGFSNAGLFYLPLGDGGGGGDPLELAQDTGELLGKILRLDLSQDDFPSDDTRDYAIPADNPFVSGGGRAEIFAIGLRNPFRSSVDRLTGDLFIGDVGQNAIEEIDRLPADGGGTNYGWDNVEGTQLFEGPDSADFTPPVAEYAHGSGPFQGQSVTGGVVYRGAVSSIQNHYVFGDFISGNFWSIPVDDLVVGQTVPSSDFTRLNDTFPPDSGTISRIVSFGLDAEGNLLIIDISGSIYRLTPDT